MSSSPLTSSVQDNFKGFTYTGEAMIHEHAGDQADSDLESDEENEVTCFRNAKGEEDSPETLETLQVALTDVLFPNPL